MKIEGTQFDRRRKLSIAQRDEIKRLFDSGKWNKTSLAEKFGVTVNAIRFIVDPSVYKRWKENRERRGGEKQYYSTKGQAKRMQNYREYVRYVSARVTKSQLKSWSDTNDATMREYREYVKYIGAYMAKQLKKQLKSWSNANDITMHNAMAAAAGLKAVRGK